MVDYQQSLIIMTNHSITLVTLVVFLEPSHKIVRKSIRSIDHPTIPAQVMGGSSQRQATNACLLQQRWSSTARNGKLTAIHGKRHGCYEHLRRIYQSIGNQ